MRISSIASVFAFLAALPLAAFAQDSQATSPSKAPIPAATTSDQTSDLDTIICKKFPPPTGTRLGSRTICDTKRHWQELQEQSRQELEKLQNRGAPAGPGAGG